MSGFTPCLCDSLVVKHWERYFISPSFSFVIWRMWIIRELILYQVGGSEIRITLNISTEGIYCRELVSRMLEGWMSRKRVERKHRCNHYGKELLPLELGNQREVGLSEHRSPEKELWGATRSQGSHFGHGALTRDAGGLWEGPMTLGVSGKAEGWNHLGLFDMEPPIGRSNWNQLARRRFAESLMSACKVEYRGHI